MTTEQILVWVTIGAIGLIAFMVFMYGMARAKYYDECNRNAFLKAENSNLQSFMYDSNFDIKMLGEIIKELKADLSHEGELRRDASQQIEAMHNELNQLNRQVQKRGKDGRYISK
jgi:hypothetical protein